MLSIDRARRNKRHLVIVSQCKYTKNNCNSKLLYSKYYITFNIRYIVL